MPARAPLLLPPPPRPITPRPRALQNPRIPAAGGREHGHKSQSEFREQTGTAPQPLPTEKKNRDTNLGDPRGGGRMPAERRPSAAAPVGLRRLAGRGRRPRRRGRGRRGSAVVSSTALGRGAGDGGG
ncbi:hypothetical protein PVAP13_1NG288019 [Panicum virgatum]|uniref:Uncharacterized protein n=1 Tax=Panicum virgatum TaxID=38727 RepID=A0A8T0WYP6_PANVG|nr:hypothetical protein PVAP13_1NG288019 [Panicum virgatum]